MTNPLDPYFAAQDAEHALQETRVDWDTWRARYRWEEALDIERTDRKVFRGHTLVDGGYALTPPWNFRDRPAWCDGKYRQVWVSEQDRTILTYCEGDLSYEVATTDEAFYAALRLCREFYRDH